MPSSLPREAPVTHALLYIEDDDNNISLVEALLRRRPHIELQVAKNGRDGIKAAIDKRPDLILLDNRLPDATGSEILQELTSTPVTAAIPVVVLSSDVDELIDQLLANGAAEAVPKPFDIHLFMAMIDRYFPATGTLASGRRLLLAPPAPPAEHLAVPHVRGPGLVDRVGVVDRRALRRLQPPDLFPVQVAADIADRDRRDLVGLDEPQVARPGNDPHVPGGALVALSQFVLYVPVHPAAVADPHHDALEHVDLRHLQDVLKHAELFPVPGHHRDPERNTAVGNHELVLVHLTSRSSGHKASPPKLAAPRR
jgi:CheY-like chemotaxis protein